MLKDLMAALRSPRFATTLISTSELESLRSRTLLASTSRFAPLHLAFSAPLTNYYPVTLLDQLNLRPLPLAGRARDELACLRLGSTLLVKPSPASRADRA